MYGMVLVGSHKNDIWCCGWNTMGVHMTQQYSIGNNFCVSGVAWQLMVINEYCHVMYTLNIADWECDTIL